MLENFISFNKKNIKINKNEYIKPILSICDINNNKTKILYQIYNKPGIYRWTNIKTNKVYIGSSVNLYNRLKNYLSFSFLKNKTKKGKSIIYNSLLKNNYCNFNLDILEYCHKKNLIEREQFYLDLLKPQYNICKIAGSSKGYKHSEEVIEKIRTLNIGKKHSNVTRKKIGNSNKLAIRTNQKTNFLTKETRFKLACWNKGIIIKEYDVLNNLKNTFPTITSFAKYLNFSHKTARKIVNKGTYNNLIYTTEIKEIKIQIFDQNYNLIEILNNQKEVLKKYNVPESTLSYYVRSQKLYKKKFYFHKLENKDSFT